MIVPLTPLEFRQRAVSLYGAKVGVVDGDKRFTYNEYDERVNRVANALSGLGVVPGDVVSFLTYNTHQLLEAYYAVPQIGAVLNPINIRLTHHEIEYILNHAESGVLFFQQDFLPLVESMRGSLPGMRHYVIMESEHALDWARDYEALLADVSPEAEVDLDAVDENAIVELFYTSGTTGPPKGVAITHRSLYLHTLNALATLRLSDEDTLLHVVPLFHVNGWGTPQFLTAVGGRHVMLRTADYGELLRLVEQERVTRLLGVPTIFNGMLQHPDLKRRDLSSLQECIIGGAPSPLSLVEAIEEQIGCKAIVGYGLTETTPILTHAAPKAHLGFEDDTARRKVQVKTGLPLVGVRLRVVDDAGNDVSRDDQTIGEIIIRSNVVMDGYLKDPQATAQVIVDGWFHTGDMATVDAEGYVTIADRKKDIIISGGENISSVEVEKVLSNHPAVFEVVVIGVPDDQWGEVPLALVVQAPDQQVTEEQLIEHARQHLAGFKVPRRIEFRDELPKGGTGKILKRELREPYWAELEKRVH